MLDVLRTFVRAKNGGTRYETRRRKKGPWDMKQEYQGYRDWVLDEWELHGAPTSGRPSSKTLYRRQPVYAIVGGIADEDWSPIDAFCARHRIPAVLPQTPPAARPPGGDGFYSFYFSKGVALEAQAIASHLPRPRRPGPGGAAGLAMRNRQAMRPRRALARALERGGAPGVRPALGDAPHRDVALT